MIWTNICAIFLRSVGEHERSECEHQFWKKNLPNGRLCLYFKIWFLVQWTMRVISLILRVIYIVCTLTFLLSKFSLKIKSIGGSQWESVYVYMTTHNFWKMLATSRHKIIYKFVMDLCKRTCAKFLSGTFRTLRVRNVPVWPRTNFWIYLILRSCWDHERSECDHNVVWKKNLPNGRLKFYVRYKSFLFCVKDVTKFVLSIHDEEHETIWIIEFVRITFT